MGTTVSVAIGVSVGFVVGIGDGITDGVCEGANDGSLVGVTEGVSVGTVAVGVSVGVMVGTTDGTTDGVCEGANDGSFVGVTDGISVGKAIGTNVGKVVGALAVCKVFTVTDSEATWVIFGTFKSCAVVFKVSVKTPELIEFASEVVSLLYVAFGVKELKKTR